MVMNGLPVKPNELSEVSAFQALPSDQLERMAAVMVRQTYAPGQIIFVEGETTRSLWFVAQGQVKIIKQSLNGRIQGLCLMDRGKCFGSCPLFMIEKNPATAQALTEVTLFVLPEEAFQQLTARDPQLVKVMLHIYSQRLEHLAHVNEVLGAWTIPDRINDCLLTYANRSAAQPVVELTHEKLAALSGSVREVVTRHLLRLEKAGIIHCETGRIIILNPDALLPPCACKDEPASS